MEEDTSSLAAPYQYFISLFFILGSGLEEGFTVVLSASLLP
jgi:hypothetical protein